MYRIAEETVGLVIHSLLSRSPRDNYYTDGTNIYYARDELGRISNVKQQQDVIREYEIARILSYPLPQSYEDFLGWFGECDGHLRLNNFQYAFQSDVPNGNNDYFQRIALTDLVRQEEKHLIKARLRKHLPTIKELLDALEQDEQPLPSYAERLMVTLSEYEPAIRSYKPNRSMIVAA